jgi:methylmalonyl-CoA mutase cobalamin-binding subunit
VRQGLILVSVQTHHDNEIRRARRVLEEAGADDISVVSEEGVPEFAGLQAPGATA